MSEETPIEEVAEEAPKKEKRVKKEEPKEAPAPKRENPIPGSPEIDDLFPGDEGYRYGTAFEMIVERINDLEDEIKELHELRRNIAAVQPKAKPLDSVEMWQSQQAIQRRLKAEEDDRKLKVQAVLREMKLL